MSDQQAVTVEAWAAAGMPVICGQAIEEDEDSFLYILTNDLRRLSASASFRA